MRHLAVMLAWLLSVTSGAFATCQHCHRDTLFNRVADHSTHGKKGVTCLACHVEQNPLKNITAKLSGLISFSFKKTHLAAAPADPQCLRCHQAIRRFNHVAPEALPLKLKTIGLVVAHQRHAELRDSCLTCHAAGKLPANPAFRFISARDPMGCIACHNKIVHAVPQKYETNMPTEQQCGYCHGSNMKCPSLKKISDIKDKGRCVECHPNQYSL